MPFDTLQVILKVSERCNLACTYCYYFYAGDDTYAKRPPVMKESTAEEVADFLNQGVRDLGISRVLIAFHGGEPLLLKPERFRFFCDIFRRKLNHVQLGFQVQTNAVLINDEWIATFQEYEVNVGISIDGGEQENDKFRIANNGKGSYNEVVAGLRKVQAATQGVRALSAPSTISVINAAFDYRKIFKHLHEDLGVEQISFLFPDVQHDTGLPFNTPAERYGEILCQIFDAWIETGAQAKVRQIDRLLSFFQQINEVSIPSNSSGQGLGTQIIVVQSDGELSLDDSYMVALEWRQSQKTPHVAQTSLETYLAQPVFADIDAYRAKLPSTCKSCCWSRVCRGGDLENRYSKLNGFDNPSVFCDGLKKFYTHVTKYLIANGYSRFEIERRLLGKGTAV
ncbi:radical SAM protein [Undibacterium luofuense]|uniref:Radical SAM protein n=1 Tax=Undibacterium luofuense TaxID=2828733 RepID=A0A941DLR4_9BURK|nr:radical SAM protein [Undibacterium luofuense]MBR7781852.1 radical SAM protein [Undibacterium luofuense]